ncbi:MAG: DEAD/DEAH box helicase [Thermodesulfobacteriota bacterium]|nr:DEAD/DEAH box helicase [Thermodesulfobacteriota bacterium]
MTVNKLISCYEKLPILEKSILQILSIAYHPLNQTQLIQCLIQAGIKAANDEGFDSVTKNAGFKLLRPALDMLLEQDFLEGKTRSRLLVNRRIVEIITRQTIAAKKFPPYLKAVQTVLHLTEDTLSTNSHLEPDHLTAAIRILFYQKKMDQIKSIYHKFSDRINYVSSLSAILGEISCNPFAITWVQLLPADIHTALFHQSLIDALIYWQNKAEHFDYIEQLILSDSDRCEAGLQATVLEKWMLTGKSNQIKNWLKEHQTDNTENSLCLQGWIAFLQGKNKKAIQYYEAAYEILIKNSKKRKIYFNNFMGVFYVLALMKENSTKRLEHARIHLSIAMTGTYLFSDIYKLLNYSLQFLTGNFKAANDVFIYTYVSFFYSRTYRKDTNFIELFFKIFTYFWIDKEKAKENLSTIKEIYKSAEINAYPWFKHELAGLINILSSNGKKTTYKPESKYLINVIQQTNIWEHTLNALLALKDKSRTKTEQVDDAFRMVWFLDYQDNGYCSVRPREQKRKPNGRWTKGRPIALKRLNDELESFSYLTSQDKQICSHIYEHEYKDGWYTNVEYIFDDKYLSAVIGHPLIFLQDGISRVELVKGKPELRITKQKDKQIFLELVPEPSLRNEANYQTIKETETRIKLVQIDDEYQRIAELLGKGIQVPASAKNKVRQIIEQFASDITIHSDIGGKGEQLVEIGADTKLHVHLIPFGNGLKISIFVRPFGLGGVYYSPGSGGRNVIAEISGKQLQTTRDLAGEKQKVAELIDNCPTLQPYEENKGEWLLGEIGDSLEVLLELDELRQQIVLEWPEGEKFKVAGQASLGQLHLGIKQQQDWFAVTGKLVIDKQLVVDMQQLLALTEKSQSRFIELKDGQFIALTNEFRKRLQELNRYSEKYGKGIRFHPLAALALESLTNGVGQLKTDMAWKSHVKKLQSAQDFTPQLPSTLQAELRGYQLQGFQWLATLSHWDVGACLADDMGLGKTLQALAMLLKHAPNGPSLVVAPTSVCMNWLAETKRFAPTLNMVQLVGAKREKILDGAGKFDIILCSYGLLQQDRVGQMLAVVPWQMVVLDEAQAIKNVFTKRSQAAMKLQAKFRLLTTGTPIENHLGELWNLFHFINPGLLSSLESFNKNFAVPIEKYKDRQSRRHLQKLIQPFILRRMKSQVLEELPARTEIRLTVELSMEEMAFYEALRQQAAAQLSELEEKPIGKKYLKILAEIMKLRRACCNSVLVNEEIVLPSSKMAMFGEVLQELLENKHKALVFSQFVGHLSLIRSYLDEQNIHYQYLDGSTPVKQRKIAVDSFQAGKGDVFLISLKAGGLGLNLTAADYVIHMDPWWNPAVEDQASDRAHRIGQQRPVTIYRLVAKDTIEEKIAEMHNRKRDLAESLLQGSDISGKISGEELLELITN